MCIRDRTNKYSYTFLTTTDGSSNTDSFDEDVFVSADSGEDEDGENVDEDIDMVAHSDEEGWEGFSEKKAANLDLGNESEEDLLL